MMAIVLRKPLIELLHRAESAEGFGAKLTFRERIDQVREAVEVAQQAQVPRIEQNDEALALPPPEPEPEALRDLTDALDRTSASGSIVAAWIDLERGLAAIAKFNHLEWDKRNFSKNLKMFEQTDLLPSDLGAAVRSLRSLRNEVVHGGRVYPTLADAEAFRATAKEIVDTVGLNAGLHLWR